MKKAFVSIAAAIAGYSLLAGFDPAKLQELIDRASAAGGGTVVVPKGTWETGPLALRSKVTLHLDKDAKLLGNPNPKVYQKANLPALIHCEGVEDVVIEGEGVIDGRGGRMASATWRPHLVNFRRCRNVRVDGVTLRCGGSWTLNPVRSDGVVIRNVKIWSHANHCNDGIDISSRNVLIENCDVDADDDALVFKTTAPDVVVENVTVRNCRLKSSCNAIKFGTETHNVTRNVTISDCEISAPSAQARFDWRSDAQGIDEYLAGLAGIAVECVDGGSLENVTVRNIRMTGCQTPIFVRLGSRKAARDGMQSFLRNVLIENVTATAMSRIACSVTGVPGLRPQGITLRNIDLTLPGGGTAQDALMAVPEKEASYPDAHMFNGQILPAHAFYVRHADGVRLENVTVRLKTPDARPAVVADDANVETDIKGTFRMTPEKAKAADEKLWKSLETPTGYVYVPPTSGERHPPLYVSLGFSRGKPSVGVFAECRKRGWAMLQPFAKKPADVLAAIDAVADRVDPARVFLKGDGGFSASLALATLAAAPTRFAGAASVLPTDGVKGLSAVKGVPVEIVTALKNKRSGVALDAFADLAGAAAVPGEVADAIRAHGPIPAAYRYNGPNVNGFDRKSRPLAYRAEKGSVRLWVADTPSVSLFNPVFNRFATLPPRTATGKRRLFLIGDSTLQRRSAENKAGSWGMALADSLSGDVEIVNCAIGGRSTRTYMPHWQTNVVHRIRAGDWVIVQFGHNDMSRCSDPKVDRQTDPDTEYMNNLLRFVADIRRAGAQPLLVTSITLYLYKDGSDKWPEHHELERWTTAMKRVAGEHDVPVVDLYSRAFAAVRDAGSAESRNWYMLSVNGKDRAHPTKLGASKLAELFVDEVRRTDSPVRVLLKD